jgi:hypothetical protein
MSNQSVPVGNACSHSYRLIDEVQTGPGRAPPPKPGSTVFPQGRKCPTTARASRSGLSTWSSQSRGIGGRLLDQHPTPSLRGARWSSRPSRQLNCQPERLPPDLALRPRQPPGLVCQFVPNWGQIALEPHDGHGLRRHLWECPSPRHERQWDPKAGNRKR